MSKCRWRPCVQFSLRSLFLLMLVLAVFFGGYGLGERNAEREAARKEKERERLLELARAVQTQHDTTAVTFSGSGTSPQVFSFYVGMMR